MIFEYDKKFMFLSKFCLNGRKKEGGRILILRSARASSSHLKNTLLFNSMRGEILKIFSAILFTPLNHC